MSTDLPPPYRLCTVDQAGATAGDMLDGPPDASYDPGGLYVILTDVGGAFQKQFFYFHKSVPREMLAVALTAISTERQVGAIVVQPTPDDLIGLGTCWDLRILAH